MAADGAVDFSRADPLDRDWNTRLAWAIEAYVDRTEAQTVQAELQRWTAVLGSDDAALFNKAWPQTTKLLARLDVLRRPWLDCKPRGLERDEMEDLFVAYTQAFGDPRDPEYQKVIEETVRKIKSGAYA